MPAKYLLIIRNYVLSVSSQRKYNFYHQNTLLDAFRTNSRNIIGRNPSMVIPLLANQDLTPMLVELVVELEVVELFEVVLLLLIVEDGADRETRSYLNNVEVSEVIKVSVLRNCLVMTLIGMLAAKLEVIWKNSIQKQGVCKMYIITDGLFLLKIQEIEDNTMYSC